MSDLFAPLTLPSSVMMKNRFMLAPLTNCLSHEDGRLSEEQFRWLVMRAIGGFAATMTGAASVQASGKGFAGQLVIYSDEHIEGLSRLAAAIRAESSNAPDPASLGQPLRQRAHGHRSGRSLGPCEIRGTSSNGERDRTSDRRFHHGGGAGRAGPPSTMSRSMAGPAICSVLFGAR
jgi:hypothetical protein